MTYKILCKQIELADVSKQKIVDKIKRLDKFFGSDEECKICVSEQKEQMVVEITFMYKGYLIRSDARNRDLLTAVDVCLSNIDRQIRKNKTKLAKRLRDDALENYDINIGEVVEDNKQEYEIIKKKTLDVKPMMVEEAILQMNMLGHDFFIFKNPDTNKMEVVYRRKDGNYALIETE